VKLGDGLKWLEYLPIVGFAAKGVKHISFYTVFICQIFYDKMNKTLFSV
jgi:hypothetical protein